MAYTSGTASNHRDLLRLLRVFVTQTMQPDTERWQELEYIDDTSEHKLLLRGPGLAGQDDVFIGIDVYDDGANDIYGWRMTGAAGFLPGLPIDAQPGGSPIRYLPLWNAPIEYHFTASGRRIVVLTRVENTFLLAYLGLILPYATPLQYPFPHCVAGAMSASRYSDVTDCLCVTLRTPGGNWIDINRLWPSSLQLQPSPGSIYPLLPLVASGNEGNDEAVYGELDGLFWVSGYGNAAGNTLTDEGARQYKVWRNVDSAIDDFVALNME